MSSPGNISGGRGGDDSDDFESANEETHDEDDDTGNNWNFLNNTVKLKRGMGMKGKILSISSVSMPDPAFNVGD